MSRFRKKPVVIEARQFTEQSRADVMAWCGSTGDCISYHRGVLGFIVPTLEGQHIAMLDDWIIKGVKGEFYPCKPDIFAATYEPEFVNAIDSDGAPASTWAVVSPGGGLCFYRNEGTARTFAEKFMGGARVVYLTESTGVGVDGHAGPGNRDSGAPRSGEHTAGERYAVPEAGVEPGTPTQSSHATDNLRDAG